MNPDPELVAAAKREIACAHGLDTDRSQRLVGSTAQALYADAALWAKQEGILVERLGRCRSGAAMIERCGV